MTAPVTVVVPTRNRPEQLRACVDAVRATLRDGDELVVVDSASTVPLGPVVGARVVRVDLPGASRARNAGWRVATHDVVLFTDDDCLPAAGWAEAYAARFASDAAVTFLWGPATVAVGGTGTTDVPADGPASAVRGDDVGPLGASCNLAVRRSALEQVGGFDELLGAGVALRASEDKDLLLRLLEAGGVGALEAAASVQHEVWRSRAQAVRLNHHYGIGQGAMAHKTRALGVDARRAFPDALVRTHVQQGIRALRDGYQTGVLTAAARASGVVRGRWQARRLRVVDGHLRP